MLDLSDLFDGVSISDNPNIHTELEVKFKPYPVYKAKEQFDTLLSKLRFNYDEIYEESTVYSYQNDVRKIVTNDSTTFERKTRIKDYKKYIDYHFVISFSEEETLTNMKVQNTKPFHVRKRQRYSFKINDHYRVDLTKVPDKNNKDFYEIELEYTGSFEKFDLDALEDEISYIYLIVHQSENFVTPTQITNLVNQFNNAFGEKPQKTFNKNISPKARNIQYRDLSFGGIVGNPKEEYVVSHKADGKHYYLILNNEGVWLVSNNQYNLLYSSQTKKAFGGNEFFVFETEVVYRDVKYQGKLVKYYVLIFDCIYYKQEDVRMKNIWERVGCIASFIGQLPNMKLFQDDFVYFVEKKVYAIETVDDFFKATKLLLDDQDNLEYPTDGLIFSPSNQFNYHSDKLPLSQRDLHTVSDYCKWKPASKITIDYRVVKNGNQINLLVYNVIKKLEVPFFGTNAYPITQDMIYDGFDDEQYLDKIVECYYDIVCHQIRPLKIRLDKEGPNRLDIAESNWYDVHNPILIEDLTGQSLTLVNKYHNQIKNILFSLPTNYESMDIKLPENYNLLDIGGGRGGDLARWIKSKVNQVITVEPNLENLKELKSRLSNSILKDRVTYINTIGEDTVQITETVEKLVGKVDVISLMLSLSFFWADEKHLDALVQTIVHNLKLGGYVLFFTINDQLEKELAKSNPLILNNASFTLYDDKYVRAEIPGIVGKQWEFIVKINQLTLKLIQYGFVLKDKTVANQEALLTPDAQTYTSLFTYGYYQKTKDIKPGKLRNIKLPKTIYPTIVTEKLLVLKDDEEKPLKNMIRIGCIKGKDNMLDAILKAYNKNYQEDNKEKVIEELRLELSNELPEYWAYFYGKTFLNQIVNVIQGNLINDVNDINDYSLLSLQHIYQYDVISESLLRFLSYIISIDIYIYVYDKDLKLHLSTYDCYYPDHESIFLLKLDDHYELLAQRTDKDKELRTYFLPDSSIVYHAKKDIKEPNMPEISYKELVKQKLGAKLPNLEDIISTEDPMYQIITECYTDTKIYVKGLSKTISKNYVTSKTLDDDVKKIFNASNPAKELKKYLADLKPIVKKPQPERIEERISQIIKILNGYINPSNNNSVRVLDIGAGKGEIITAMKEYYHLPKENVFAIDQKLPNIKTITPLTYKNGLIPLADQSINVILLFAVLHHIPTKERLGIINEIARVLTPDGIVIIREHDDDHDPNFYTFIDLIHQFWYFTEKEQEDPLNMMDYNELLKLFDNVKMHSIYHDSYTEPNPQHLYHEAFMFKFQDDFPYKRYSMNIEDVDKRFENLKSYEFNFVHMPYTIRNIPGTWYQDKTKKYNNIIIKNEASDYLNYNLIADYWMDPCRMQAKRYDQPLTPIEYWQQNKEYVKQEAFKNYGFVDAYTLRETIFKLAGEVTDFRNTLMVGFIKMFKAKRVLDVSSGWGPRIIGAMAMNVQYTGVDPNSCLHPKYKEMIQHFAKDPSKYITIQAPFETAELPPKLTYDLIISSPPFFQLEKYSNEETQSIHNRSLNEWFDDFLIASLNKAWDKLVKGGHMVININDIYNVANYCELMVNVFNDIHEDDAEYLGVIGYSEFVKGKPRSVQPVFCWRKI